MTLAKDCSGGFHASIISRIVRLVRLISTMCIIGKKKCFAALKQFTVVLDLSKLEISPLRLILIPPAKSVPFFYGDDAVTLSRQKQK